MAKRKHKKYRVVDSSEIQGEGSFVKIKNISLNEILGHSQGAKGKPDDEEAAQMGLQILDDMIVDWDWVDDEDNPLPVPAENPGTIASLPFQESSWLLNKSGIEKLLDQKN
ncbi:MAG: hypothetical protein ACYSYU_10795 [Planctomycetota bacterium]|jgi:hypothetical protein